MKYVSSASVGLECDGVPDDGAGVVDGERDVTSKWETVREGDEGDMDIIIGSQVRCLGFCDIFANLCLENTFVRDQFEV